MDVQAIHFSATESASNLQAALSYIMLSCLKKSCFWGVCCLFFLSLQDALANQAECLSCSFRALKKKKKMVSVGLNAFPRRSVWHQMNRSSWPCFSLLHTAQGREVARSLVCAMGETVHAYTYTTYITPQLTEPRHKLHDGHPHRIYTYYPISSFTIRTKFCIPILPIKMEDAGSIRDLSKVTQPLTGRAEIYILVC